MSCILMKIKYIGEDRAEIRKGDVYKAENAKDDSRYYAVTDRSGEIYCYPKTLFEIVKD